MSVCCTLSSLSSAFDHGARRGIANPSFDADFAGNPENQRQEA
jgi:hypothetical protein